MNDNTRIRIKVPAHLYESVKKQLMIKEGSDFGMPGSTTIKEKKPTGTSTPKASGMPKAKSTEPTEEKTEKTLEERVAELEEALKALKATPKKEEDDEAKKPVKDEGKKEEEDEAKKPVKEDAKEEDDEEDDE